MWTLIFFAVIGFIAFRHMAKKKRRSDIRNWSVDFRHDDIRPVTRRLPWKDLL